MQHLHLRKGGALGVQLGDSSFDFTEIFLSLCKAFGKTVGDPAGLGEIQQVCNGFFHGTLALAQCCQLCARTVVLLKCNQLLGNGLFGLRPQNLLQSMLQYTILQQLFADAFLLAGILFDTGVFTAGTAVIVMRGSGFTGAAVADHRAAAQAAKAFGGEQERDSSLRTSGGFFVFFHFLTHPFIQVFLNDLWHPAINTNILPDVHAGVALIGEDGVHGVVCKSCFVLHGAKSSQVAVIHNFENFFTPVIALKYLPHHGGGGLIQGKPFVRPLFVSKGERPAEYLAVHGGLPHTAGHVFAVGGAVKFRHPHQHGLLHLAKRPIRHRLGYGDERDAVIFQSHLVKYLFLQIAAKAVGLPDQHGVENTAITVLQHLAELRPVVVGAAAAAVMVDMHDGVGMLFGVFAADLYLPLDGLFRLTGSLGKAGVNADVVHLAQLILFLFCHGSTPFPAALKQ